MENNHTYIKQQKKQPRITKRSATIMNNTKRQSTTRINQNMAHLYSKHQRTQIKHKENSPLDGLDH
ncbi:16848_t:CDS:2 [Acaulospora morrowiae]|uniref:16848_t:CDS:1 n=1 Tax=Acaulospora morrowiae TaxID=94023 RepID=A0A9N9N5A3_9GLOM|nr:16848_t:CDS:2 [Acaulospora morrowiae]